MKKHSRLKVLLVAGLMMIMVCSCDEKSTQTTSDDTSVISIDEKVETGEMPTGEMITTEVVAPQATGAFSDSTLGVILQMTGNLIGQDKATAEKTLGEYFGVELKDRTGAFTSGQRNDIEYAISTYGVLLSKDDVRFNDIEIWTDKETKLVRRIELRCENTTYTGFSIEDTPEFRDEIKKLHSDLEDEMKSAMGIPYQIGELAMDEDSIYKYYKLSENFLANVEIRDFTEPGGNGLLSTSVIFADCEILVR